MFLAVNGATEFSDVTDNGNYIMLLLDNRIEFFKKVTITFHSNETNQTVTQDIGYGAKTTLKYDPLVRPGYVLKGWSSNPDSQEITYSNGQTLENETALIANTDLYAIWEPEKYKVSYELNGGTAGSSSPTTHTYDTETTLVEPTREGYTFGGWYKDAALTQSAGTSLGATEYTDDITLYAKWTKTIGDKTYFVSPVVANQTYTGSAIIPDVTVKDGAGNIVDSKEYTIICSDGSNINAGKANIAVMMGKVDIGTASFTITPATLTITADNKSMYVNRTLPEYTYTVTGLMDADKENEATLLSGVSASCTGADNSKAGTYTITVSGPKDITNYTITYVSGTLTVSRRSSSSSSSTSEKTYSVSADKSKNGSVKLSDAKAAKGDTVTITVKPEDGYMLDTLTVTDADGDEVKLKDKGDGKYTFTMPDSKITVEATFVLATEVEQPIQPTAHPFADIAAGTWIDTAVQYVYANGLMTGNGSGTLSPKAGATRAETAAMLMRFCEANQ